MDKGSIRGGISETVFELIQVSIGSKEKLSSVPSTAEWEKLFVLAEKHAVIGMCFHGIQILYKYQSSQMVNLPIKLKMQWLGITSNIQIENDLLNKRAKEVTLLFAEGGFDSVVLKGQGIARLYSDSSLRQSGDIDLWVKGSREDVIAFMYWKNGRLAEVLCTILMLKFFLTRAWRYITIRAIPILPSDG